MPSPGENPVSRYGVSASDFQNVFTPCLHASLKYAAGPSHFLQQTKADVTLESLRQNVLGGSVTGDVYPSLWLNLEQTDSEQPACVNIDFRRSAKGT